MKNCIVQIDAAPFKQWYQQHYGTELGQKKGEQQEKTDTAESKVSTAGGMAVLELLDYHLLSDSWPLA